MRALASGRRRETAFMNGPSIREIDGRFCLSYWAIGGGRFFGMYHALADDRLGAFQPVGPLVSLGNAWQNTPHGATDQDARVPRHLDTFRVWPAYIACHLVVQKPRHCELASKSSTVAHDLRADGRALIHLDIRIAGRIQRCRVSDNVDAASPKRQRWS
jgi:hypothetical protein